MSQESLLGPYLKPGTPIKVGSYSTKIIRYLSEGGFSHVYIARLDIPVRGSDVAVLKRIVAPDKVALSAIRTEVDTMVCLTIANSFHYLIFVETVKRPSIHRYIHRFTCIRPKTRRVRGVCTNGILPGRRYAATIC